MDGSSFFPCCLFVHVWLSFGMIQKKIEEKEKKENEEKEKEKKEKEKKKKEGIEKEKKEKKKSLTSYLDLFSYHLAMQGQWHTLLLAFCCFQAQFASPTPASLTKKRDGKT